MEKGSVGGSRKNIASLRKKRNILKVCLGLFSLVLVVGIAGMAYTLHLWGLIEKPAEEDSTEINSSELQEILNEDKTLPNYFYDDPTESSGGDQTQTPEEPTETEHGPSAADDTAAEPSETEPEQPQETQQPIEQPTEKPTEKPTVKPTPAPTLPPIVIDPGTEHKKDPGVEKVLDGFQTFVVYGVDARNNTRITSGAQGDVVILVSINRATKEVRLSSILRDTNFQRPVAGANGAVSYTFNKITNIYRIVGAAGTMSILNNELDLNIEDFVAVNWKAVADVVNLMGGLYINMTIREADEVNKSCGETSLVTGLSAGHLELIDGAQLCDGVQVVTYARIRHIGNADYDRTNRQRTVINMLLAKAKTLSAAKLLAICETMFPEIGTSFTLSEIVEMLKSVRSYTIVDSFAYPYTFVSNDSIYVRDLPTNNKKLHEFLYGNSGYVPSDYVSRAESGYSYMWQHYGS